MPIQHEVSGSSALLYGSYVCQDTCYKRMLVLNVEMSALQHACLYETLLRPPPE